MARFTVNGGNTTITFEYTAVTAKVQSIVTDCAQYLWDHGFGDHGTRLAPNLFENLTNNQKLSLVDDYIKSTIIDTANNEKSNKAQDTARATEDANKYSL